MAEAVAEKQKEAAAVQQLWRQYKTCKSQDVRNALAEHYLSLVKIVAGRLSISLPAHIDRDDLLSSGFFGLLDAIERYDPERANKFETYACVRIRGAMLDYLRAKDWMPVTMRQRIRKYEQTSYHLETKLGRQATDEEIRKEMNLSSKEYAQLQSQLNAATLVPLDDYMTSEMSDRDAEGPGARLEAEETKQALGEAIDKLPEKEKIVISLYYYDELTLKEISKILHLTEARISQLHTKAVFRLRGCLARRKSMLL